MYLYLTILLCTDVEGEIDEYSSKKKEMTAHIERLRVHKQVLHVHINIIIIRVKSFIEKFRQIFLSPTDCT